MKLVSVATLMLVVPLLAFSQEEKRTGYYCETSQVYRWEKGLIKERNELLEAYENVRLSVQGTRGLFEVSARNDDRGNATSLYKVIQKPNSLNGNQLVAIPVRSLPGTERFEDPNIANPDMIRISAEVSKAAFLLYRQGSGDSVEILSGHCDIDQ